MVTLSAAPGSLISSGPGPSPPGNGCEYDKALDFPMVHTEPLGTSNRQQHRIFRIGKHGVKNNLKLKASYGNKSSLSLMDIKMVPDYPVTRAGSLLDVDTNNAVVASCKNM